MKTPDEIKKGLKSCSGQNKDTYCTDCPYRFESCDDLTRDALKYIEGLERANQAYRTIVGAFVNITPEFGGFPEPPKEGY